MLGWMKPNQILSGLAPGSLVMLHPPDEIEDEARVEVRK
jgi:hypothetical protein